MKRHRIYLGSLIVAIILVVGGSLFYIGQEIGNFSRALSSAFNSAGQSESADDLRDFGNQAVEILKDETDQELEEIIEDLDARAEAAISAEAVLTEVAEKVKDQLKDQSEIISDVEGLSYEEEKVSE